jgi:DNA repair photolyase
MIRKTKAKTLLSSSTKPDPWFGCKYNMNLYRGCEHKCIYCDSRSECYQIENFSDVLIKVNAIELLEDELSRKRIKGTIGFGAMCDTYTFVERKYQLTRKALEVIAKYKFPIHIITKSDMVLRDIEILKKINEEYAAITFTITTVDDKLAKIVEPYAPLPSKRLKTMKKLSDEGIYTGVTMMPILPFIEDNEENITHIIEQSKKYGAKYIIPALGMTLRDRQRAYYYKKLDKHFPGLKQKYIKTFRNNYSCGPVSDRSLSSKLYKLCRKYSLPIRIKVYTPKKVSDAEQGRLL